MQYSQESTCVRVSFNKVAGLRLLFLKFVLKPVWLKRLFAVVESSQTPWYSDVLKNRFSLVVGKVTSKIPHFCNSYFPDFMFQTLYGYIFQRCLLMISFRGTFFNNFIFIVRMWPKVMGNCLLVICVNNIYRFS